mmetsp:Transcript_5371/g.19604  ORF Transcript_5371/g.19604 Transcript_5371/m.19604 type:complete len:247 (-) Transcript_5371:317-1057(-)
MENASACGPLNSNKSTPRSSVSTLHSPPYDFIELRSFPRYSSIVSTDISSSSPLTLHTSSTASPNFCLSNFSMPPFIVAEDDAHDPHAPFSRTTTIPFSMLINSTFPPSAIKYGRTSSSALSTFSMVSSSLGAYASSDPTPSPSVTFASPSAPTFAAKGLTTGSFDGSIVSTDAGALFVSSSSSASHSAFNAGVVPNASLHRLASLARISLVAIAAFLNAITLVHAARCAPTRPRTARTACSTFLA